MERNLKIGPLKKTELAEADRIVRLAFGTFLGVPQPLDFMGDRNFITPRWRSSHVKVIAARENGRLIGSNVVTRWGSFAFFGPLTVLPEYWNNGVAQRLLEETMKIFDEWGVRHTGLFTFAQSAKHVGLYQKFGYWPRYLTTIMTLTPQPTEAPPGRQAIDVGQCKKITNKIDKGLDLTGEIQAVLKQRTGEVVLSKGAFAICLNGPGTEGGARTCYIKFAAAGTASQFNKLLEAAEAWAAARGLTIEAGVNLARKEAFEIMRNRGYRATMQGVAMQRPNAGGFNKPTAFVIDDWR